MEPDLIRKTGLRTTTTPTAMEALDLVRTTVMVKASVPTRRRGRPTMKVKTARKDSLRYVHGNSVFDIILIVTL
jgi:hypothetical protein